MSDHAPEPWMIMIGVDAHHLVDANHKSLINSHHPFFEEIERVMACVNFCRNLPTEWLEKYEADLFADDGSCRNWGNLLEAPDFQGLIPVRGVASASFPKENK